MGDVRHLGKDSNQTSHLQVLARTDQNLSVANLSHAVIIPQNLSHPVIIPQNLSHPVKIPHFQFSVPANLYLTVRRETSTW